MAKILLHGDDARQALGRGVAKLERAVRGTLGPRGMNAIIDRPLGTPMISRDGAVIAREIELEDPFENMGAQVVREVAKHTNEVAGDGTQFVRSLGQGRQCTNRVDIGSPTPEEAGELDAAIAGGAALKQRISDADEGGRRPPGGRMRGVSRLSMTTARR